MEGLKVEEKEGMTMIRCRWNYADLGGEGGDMRLGVGREEVMPKGDKGRKQRGERTRE